MVFLRDDLPSSITYAIVELFLLTTILLVNGTDAIELWSAIKGKSADITLPIDHRENGPI